MRQAVKLVMDTARKHGWDVKKCSKHPLALVKNGARPVPVKPKLNRIEVHILLKQLSIPRTEWPREIL